MKKLLLTAIAVLGFTASAHAALIFTGSNASTGGTLSAKATFDISGTDLLVTLTNTSTADVLVPVDVLTAVFFKINGDPALTSTSAVLASGSTVFFDTPPAGGVVGGEWAYLSGLSQYGANKGISSSGFGIFGSATFPGSNLDPPTAVDGLNYGITSAVDNSLTGNSAVTGGVPLIQNSVLFTLGGLPSGFNLSSISDVTFQYGTALDEGHFPGDGGGRPNEVPIPAAAWLLGTGLFGLVGVRRRMRK